MDQFSTNENISKQWKSIYTLGAIFPVIAFAGILLDVVIGILSGGNLSPATNSN